MKPSEILDKAQDEIRERGWYQGDYVSNETGGVCALGAIRCAVDGEFVEFDDTFDRYCLDEAVFHHLDDSAEVCAADAYAMRAVPADVRNDFGSELRFVPSFNDMPTTSVEDVLLMLKRGAELAREDGK